MNHKRCSISTGVHGYLTFGYGKLDSFGFWEFGCPKCAREYEKKYPGSICWPHTEEQLKKIFPLKS